MFRAPIYHVNRSKAAYPSMPQCSQGALSMSALLPSDLNRCESEHQEQELKKGKKNHLCGL